jgi:uncharacterized membrane protein
VADHPHPSGLTAAEHKTISRVESFGDIVFGFSLFNLAVNLHPPTTSSAFLAETPEFVLFLVTFGILCSFWWMHHRLFKDYFKPDTIGLMLNFAFLAGVALFSFPLQLYLRFGFRDPLTVAAYAGANLALFGLISAMIWKGLRQLGPSLTEEWRRYGRGMAIRTSILSALMLCSICLYRLGPQVMVYPIVAMALIIPIHRRMERRAAALSPSET